MNIKKGQLNSLNFFEGFFGSKKIFVPNYQRRYHWTEKKNWKPFWESILNLIGKPADNAHFIGNLIIQKRKTQSNQEEYTEYEVVDGHQRLATFFLLLSAQIRVINTFIEKTNSKIEITRLSKLISKIETFLLISFITEKSIPRLVPFNSDDTKIFNKIISNNNLPIEKKSSSDSLLEKAHIYFTQQILKAKDPISTVEKTFGIAARSVAFTLVELEENLTRMEVLNVFQTINETGSPLTSSDLTKGLLFEKEEEEKEGINNEEESVEKKWEEIEKKFGGNKSKRLSDFLYCFLAAAFKRQKTEAKLLQKEFYEFAEWQFSKDNQNKISVSYFLKLLENYSEIYEWILNPSRIEIKKPSEEWNYEFKELLMDIKQLNFPRFHPFILALYFNNFDWEKEGFNDIEDWKNKIKLLDLVTKYWFRRRSIKKKTPTDIEKKLYNWIELLKNNKPESILEILRDKELENEFKLEKNSNEFYSEIKILVFKSSKSIQTLGRYILGKYYLKLKKDKDRSDLFEWRKEKAQIEHLFPENPEIRWAKIEEWKEVIEDAEKVKKIKNSLGNLSIVDNKGNNEVKNKIWSEKLASKKYRENICLKLEEWGKNLLEKDKITPKNIRDRASNLGEEIKKSGIFEFDFSCIGEEKKK